MTSAIFRDSLLEGRVCVVTGAGTGLGRAAAIELAALGATVIVCGRRVEPLVETCELIEQAGGRAWHASVDVRDESAVDGFVDDVLERYERIDVLVNNAGGQFLAPAESITPKGFQSVVDLNVMGTWNMTHAVATKAMVPQSGGKILNVTGSPHNGQPGLAHSCAARAAVENLTRTLSIEWARFGITLTAVAAGHFDTEVVHTKYPPEVSEQLRSWVPLGRLGNVSEWAWLVAFLASPAGEYFSGNVITLDGARDNWFGAWPPPGLLQDGAAFHEARRP